MLWCPMVTAATLVLMTLSTLPKGLPVPPPPASPTYRLTSHLTAGLLARPDSLPATATYRITVTVDGAEQPRLSDFIANQLEAAIQRSALGTTRHQSSHMTEPTHEVSVALRVRNGRLDAEARLLRLPGTIWEWVRTPDGVLVATALASAQMDLELHQLTGTPSLVGKFKRLRYVDVTSKSDAALTRAPMLDMVHVDLDGDGFRELVCLQEERLLSARWTGRGFELIETTSLMSMEMSHARLRQPMGRLVPLTLRDGTMSILVASSGRGATALWRYGRDSWHLVEERPAAGHWPLYALGPGEWLTQGRLSEEGVLEGATIGLVAPSDDGTFVEQALASSEEAIFGLKAFAFFQASTPSWLPFFVRSSPRHGLSVWSPLEEDNAVTLPDAGDAAVICDLDANGTPELIHTSNALHGRDRLTWLELGGSRSGRVRWRTESAGPVTALAAADVDGDGYQEVVAASWSGEGGHLHLVTPLVTR